MTERRYTRPEFEKELVEVSRSLEVGAACRRLLSWYDEVMYDLGQVGALREALRKVTAEKVEAEVLAEELEARLFALGQKARYEGVEDE